MVYKIVSFSSYPLEAQKGWFKIDSAPPIEIDIIPNNSSFEMISKLVKGADAIITNPGVMLTREILSEMKGVKVLQFVSIGYDAVDLKAATELGIPVANNPGFCAIPVAEHAIMGMLTLLRYGAYSHFELMRGNWVQKEVDYKLREINGKTVGILGLGSVGIEVAKRLKGFNVKILYNKRNRIDSETEKELGVEYCSFDELLEKSDIITVHVPLTQETKGMIGKNEIGKMKTGALLINTARGPIVDEVALAEALRSGKLAGAALDVPRYTPGDIPKLVENFKGIKNILLTPHIAANSPEAEIRWSQQFAANVVKTLNGSKPDYLVN